MARPPVLVLCKDPQLGGRIESAVAGAGGAPSAEPSDARLIVWTDSAGAIDGAPDGAPIAAVSEHDLAGVVELLRREQVVCAIRPEAVDRALEPALSRLLGGAAWLDEVTSIEVDDHAGRQRALDAVDQLATERRMRRTARDRIASTCDELLMNALYDAPIDESGALVFGDVEPADRVSMKSPRPVSLRFGPAGDHLAVSVTDRYGRLERATVLDTLHKCMSSGDQIDRKKLGSGLGLYMAASAATDLVIDVSPGATTEVIARFARDRTPLEVFGYFTGPARRSPQGRAGQNNDRVADA